MSVLSSACRLIFGEEYRTHLTCRSIASLRCLVSNLLLSDLNVTQEAVHEICERRSGIVDALTPMIYHFESCCAFNIDLWIYPKGCSISLQDHPGQASLYKVMLGAARLSLYTRVDGAERIYPADPHVGLTPTTAQNAHSLQPELLCVSRKPKVLRIGQKVRAVHLFEGVVGNDVDFSTEDEVSDYLVGREDFDGSFCSSFSSLIVDTSFVSLPSSANIFRIEPLSHCAVVMTITSPPRCTVYPRRFAVSEDNPRSPHVVLEVLPRLMQRSIHLALVGDRFVEIDDPAPIKMPRSRYSRSANECLDDGRTS